MPSRTVWINLLSCLVAMIYLEYKNLQFSRKELQNWKFDRSRSDTSFNLTYLPTGRKWSVANNNVVKGIHIHPSDLSLERGTRQFTDKTVHWHGFWRQFLDRIEDSSPTHLKTVHHIYGPTPSWHSIDLWLINKISNYESSYYPF